MLKSENYPSFVS